MNKKIYDFAIIGAGAAGLHLAQNMLRDPWFANKSILILEKESKETDDRTWCFWESGAGKWDHLVSKSWESGAFTTNKNQIPLSLPPYRYKLIHSIDFYRFGKEQLRKSTNIDWINDVVLDVEPGRPLKIIGQHNPYFANQIFDSRVEAHDINSGKYIHILQHFKGWEIETKEDVFDPEHFVMMDYRVKWQNETSFTYVLPTSKNKALIEFTLFNSALLDNYEYDDHLKTYIKNILGIDDFKITKEEYGVIPMSNYPFHAVNSKGITKIGTAGSWVKPSSGYAFRNIEKMTLKLIQNLKKNRLPSHGLLKPRFRFYDTVFLSILQTNNEMGEWIFEQMYQKNSIQQIFKFLDEETTLGEEMRILSRFEPKPFLKALARLLIQRIIRKS